MKRKLAIGAALVVGAIALAIGGIVGGNVVGVEKRAYEETVRDGRFTIRTYPPVIVAETLVEGGFDDVGGTAFRRLAGYIFGANHESANVAMTAPVSQQARPAEPGRKIAMTAPVSQALSGGTDEEGGAYRVTFMMPTEYALEDLPQPDDARITLREEPGGRYAATTYSGVWSRERYDRNLHELEAWVAERGLTVTGPPVWARYDPPFMPWFLRRNDILLPLEIAGG